MALSKDEIIEAIAAMSVTDVVELVKAMEEKFGVSAAAAVVAGVSEPPLLPEPPQPASIEAVMATVRPSAHILIRFFFMCFFPFYHKMVLLHISIKKHKIIC